MGSGACARGFRTPRSRESLEGSLPAHYEAQGQCPLYFPGGKPPHGREVGHQGLKTPQWSAVTARPARKPVPCSLPEHGPLCAERRSAPSGSEQRRSFGSEIENRIRGSRGNPAARTEKLGCLTIGSALTPPHPEERPRARLRASSTRYGRVSKDAGDPVSGLMVRDAPSALLTMRFLVRHLRITAALDKAGSKSIIPPDVPAPFHPFRKSPKARGKTRN
jgi:hypothetical protein